MHEDLCASVGEERLDKISDLTFAEVDHICNTVKCCEECPLALFYMERNEEQYLCIDYSTKTRVNKILRNGGYFKTLKGI